MFGAGTASGRRERRILVDHLTDYLVAVVDEARRPAAPLPSRLGHFAPATVCISDVWSAASTAPFSAAGSITTCGGGDCRRRVPMATRANGESFQALIDDIQRTIAVAAWQHSLIHVDAEARQIMERHGGSVVPLAELREHVIRLAAERRVPTEIG
jgi:hypothetical protein